MPRRPVLSVIVSAIDRISAPLQNINRSIQRLTRPIRLVNRSLASLGRAAGLARFTRALRMARMQAGNVARSIGSILRRLGLISGVAIGGGLALINSFARAGDSIDKTARRLGFSNQSLQEWQHVAELSGVSTDLFNNSLSAFGKRLGEARAGTGGLTTLLSRVSPALLEQLKNTNSVEEAFNLYINAVGQISDESRKAALTSAAFSRAGLPLTNIMNLGSEAIARQRQEKVRLGIIDEAGIKSAAGYQDAIFRLTEAFAGVRNVIAGQVLPILNPLINRFVELIIEIRPQIEKWAQGFARALPARLQLVWSGLQTLLAGFRSLISFGKTLSENTETVRIVLGALAVIIGGALLSALGSAILTIRALGLALLSTPIGVIITGIGLLIAAAFLIVKNWEPIKAFFSELWDTVTASFFGAVECINTVFSELWQSVENLFDNGIKYLQDQLASLTDLLPDFVTNGLGLNSTLTTNLNTNALGQQLAQPNARSESTLNVQFENAPSGTRVESQTDSNTNLNLDLGYLLVTP